MANPDVTRTARVEARIAPDALAVVRRAAELQGRSVSDFLVAAALKDPAVCGYPAEQVTLLTDESATREGVLSALAGLNIWHAEVTLQAADEAGAESIEVPILDGSALDFVHAIDEAKLASASTDAEADESARKPRIVQASAFLHLGAISPPARRRD
mgnify:CR=1 FL=1